MYLLAMAFTGSGSGLQWQPCHWGLWPSLAVMPSLAVTFAFDFNMVLYGKPWRQGLIWKSLPQRAQSAQLPRFCSVHGTILTGRFVDCTGCLKVCIPIFKKKL
jgi:hypothetical protein